MVIDFNALLPITSDVYWYKTVNI